MTAEMLTIVALLGSVSVFALIASSDSDDSDESQEDTERPQISLTEGDDIYVKAETSDEGDIEYLALAGEDRIVLDDADDVVRTGDGLSFVAAGSGDDVIYSGSDEGLFLPGAGNDEFYGGSGQDLVSDGVFDLEGIAENIEDLYVAQADFPDYDEVPDEVAEADPLNPFNYGQIDSLFERDDDVFYLGAGDDEAGAGLGADTIYGGAGDDVIGTFGDAIGNAPDAVYGGSGDDSITIFDGDYVESGSGADRINIFNEDATDLADYRPVIIGDFDVENDELYVHDESFLALNPEELDRFGLVASERDDTVFVDLVPRISDGNGGFVDDPDSAFSVAEMRGLSLADVNAAIDANRISH